MFYSDFLSHIEKLSSKASSVYSGKNGYGLPIYQFTFDNGFTASISFMPYKGRDDITSIGWDGVVFVDGFCLFRSPVALANAPSMDFAGAIGFCEAVAEFTDETEFTVYIPEFHSEVCFTLPRWREFKAIFPDCKQ